MRCSSWNIYNIWSSKLELYIYVSVNLRNEAIRELTDNFRQFVKCLFQSVILFFYACKTLKPGLFWYAVEREPVRLESKGKRKVKKIGVPLAPHSDIYISRYKIYIDISYEKYRSVNVCSFTANLFANENVSQMESERWIVNASV